MSVVGTGQFFGSPEEERDKLMQSLMDQKNKLSKSEGIPLVTLNTPKPS